MATKMTEYEKQLLAQAKKLKKFGGVFAGADIKNPSTEFLNKAVHIDPFVIRFVANQSYDLRLRAVRQNGLSLEYVNGATEEIELAAVKQNGMAIKFIRNPSREVQMAAVKQNLNAYKLIARPHKDVTLFYFEYCKTVHYGPGQGLVGGKSAR